MATTYSTADKDVLAVVKRVMADFHRDFVSADVTVEVLMAANEDGPAVKHHGWPCAATIKVNSLKDRTAGCADARMIIDAAGWESRTKDERYALIDHEIQHLELKVDKFGTPKLDDLSRPRLGTRPHDWEAGGFDTIARRHGVAAPEVKVVGAIKRRLEQLEIEWPADELAEAAA